MAFAKKTLKAHYLKMSTRKMLSTLEPPNSGKPLINRHVRLDQWFFHYIKKPSLRSYLKKIIQLSLDISPCIYT